LLAIGLVGNVLEASQDSAIGPDEVYRLLAIGLVGNVQLLILRSEYLRSSVYRLLAIGLVGNKINPGKSKNPPGFYVIHQSVSTDLALLALEFIPGQSKSIGQPGLNPLDDDCDGRSFMNLWDDRSVPPRNEFQG
jgi:hypothetical protein